MIKELFEKLFKKRASKDVPVFDASTFLAAIDSDEIPIPKYSKLDPESKAKVDEYYSQLDPNDYNSILKYTADLLKKTNDERAILIKTMGRYDEWYREDKKDTKLDKDDKTARAINYALLSTIEYNIIKAAIKDTENQLFFKLVALDRFMKHEEKRRFDFLGKDWAKKRKQYLENKKRIENEIERIKKSIKINKHIEIAVDNDLKENEKLAEQYSVLQAVSMLGPNDKEKYEETVRFQFEQILRKIYNASLDYKLIDNLRNNLIRFFSTLKGKTGANKWEINDKIISEINYSLVNFFESFGLYIVDYIPKENAKEFYTIIAKFLNERELFIYRHKDDYKKYIEEMNNIIKMYENTPTKNWNLSQLQLYLEFYAKQTSTYFSACKQYITDDIREKVSASYYKLRFLYDISHMNYKYKEYNENMHKHYFKSFEEYTYWGEMKTDKYRPAFRYYAWDLLIQVEKKYGIKAEEIREQFLEAYKFEYPKAKYDKEHPEEFIKNSLTFENDLDRMICTYFIDFYDILHGDLDSIQLGFESHAAYKSFREYIRSITEGNDERHIDNIRYINNNYKNLTIDKVYYTLKYLGLNKYDINNAPGLYKIGTGPMEFGGPMTRYIAQIKLQDCENNYDDRIIVIPGTITMYIVIDDIDELNLCDNNQPIALYLPDINLFRQVINSNLKDSSKIKYIFMNQGTIKEGRQDFFTRRKGQYRSEKEMDKAYHSFIFDRLGKEGIKVIVIPDNIKYTDLSNYLDQELEKKSDNQLVRKLNN